MPTIKELDNAIETIRKECQKHDECNTCPMYFNCILPRTVTHCAKTEYEIGFEAGRQSIIEKINDAPVIDTVPVVRCKDCKHLVDCELNGIGSTRPDWFCADGERKDGENDERFD